MDRRAHLSLLLFGQIAPVVALEVSILLWFEFYLPDIYLYFHFIRQQHQKS